MSLCLSKKSSFGRNAINVIAWLFFLTGLILIGLYVYWYKTGKEILPTPKIFQAPVSTEVIEAEVSPAEVKVHTVPSKQPRYLTIDNLSIKQARVFSVGLESGTKQIATPPGIFDIGWFNQSGLQTDNGNVIFLDGHNGGPTKDGVFKHLPDLKSGSEIVLERGDGLISRYKVVENYSLPLSEYTADKIKQVMTPIDNQETLALMSCTGNWIPAQKTYSDRVVVKAVLIPNVN